MNEPLTKVYAIPQERWNISVTPCECGGRFLPHTQRLCQDGEVAIDVLGATCQQCGAERDFAFDISAFFGKEQETDEWLAKLLPDVDQKIRQKIRRRIGPPLMTRISSFVRQLANDKDLGTLTFLYAQILEALEEVTGGREADGDLHGSVRH